MTPSTAIASLYRAYMRERGLSLWGLARTLHEAVRRRQEAARRQLEWTTYL